MAKPTAERKGRTADSDSHLAGRARTVQMDLSVFLCLLGLILILTLLLWSTQRGRKVLLDVSDIDHLMEALPSMAGSSHGVILQGNAIHILQNGDGFFPRLLLDLAAARETINFETYVWWKGEICRQIAETLARKAREGVEVRLLLDASGSSRMDRDLLEMMQEARVHVRRYRPFRVSNIGRLNARDHRKIVVLDGRVGYVFGHGIGDEWLGNAEDEDHWRDTGARVEGPIVHQLQSAFTENWVEETGEILAGEQFFPHVQAAGSVPMHLAYYFNHGSVSAVDLLYRLTFSSAHRELLIQNPYLAPDPEVVELICRAADRGADVRLMLPGRVTDSRALRHAGHHLYERLLRCKVKIYEYQKTLNHQKVIVVDRVWSHIGSTNLDNRSFESNDEVSLGVIDSGVAEQLRRAFFDDLRDSQQIGLESWLRRGRWHRLQDAGAYRLNEFL